MTALTVRQPWASLIAYGAKTIETRSWRTSYRGWLAIHAAKRPIVLGRDPLWYGDYHVAQGGTWLHDRRDFDTDFRMPLGAIVATARLVDCLPIVEWGADPREDHITVGRDGRLHAWHFVPDSTPWAWMALDPARRASNGGDNDDDRSDQLPYGDFTPGRWAWLLEDAQPTTERCPYCMGVFSPCRRCADGLLALHPIPAKGKQGLWRWQS